MVFGGRAEDFEVRLGCIVNNTVEKAYKQYTEHLTDVLYAGKTENLLEVRDEKNRRSLVEGICVNEGVCCRSVGCRATAGQSMNRQCALGTL